MIIQETHSFKCYISPSLDSFYKQKFSIGIDSCFKFLLGHVQSLIFQGGVAVDVIFTSLGSNETEMDQFDDKKKKEIFDVLNEEFCSFDDKALTGSNTCSVQNLELRVKKALVVVSLNSPNKYSSKVHLKIILKLCLP